MEILLVVDDEGVKAVNGQFCLQQLNALGGGINSEFQPLHNASVLCKGILNYSTGFHVEVQDFFSKNTKYVLSFSEQL